MRPDCAGRTSPTATAIPFALLLLVLAMLVNLILQPSLLEPATLNSNMRVFLPLILVAVGQAIVILGGGIDISAGAIVSIVNALLATQIGLAGRSRSRGADDAAGAASPAWPPGQSTAFSSRSCACSRSSPPTPPASCSAGWRC